MVGRETSVPRIGRGEQSPLPLSEFDQKGRAIHQPFGTVPQPRDQRHTQREEQKGQGTDEPLEALEHPVDTQTNARDQKSHRPFGQYTKACEQGRNGQIGPGVTAEVAAFDPIGSPVEFDQEPKARKNEEIEPGVDQARLEVERRQCAAQKGDHPPTRHALPVQTEANIVDHKKRTQSCQHIGKTRSIFTDAKKLHADRLKPHKKRRLFCEGLKIELRTEVIATQDHLSGDLSKVDLIPVEEMHTSQKGSKKQ